MTILRLLLCLSLAGCATPQTFVGVCGFMPLGQNEQGIAFARVHCQAAE